MAAWARRRTLPNGQWITDEQVRALAEAVGWEEIRPLVQPNLLPGNLLAWTIYQLVSTQVVFDPSGVRVFFSIPALAVLLDIYDVPKRLRRNILDKCILLWNDMNKAVKPDAAEGGDQSQ